MGDFHAAVSTLLEAFARGSAVIRAQRSRRKKEQSINSAQKIAERDLSNSLKKNRSEIRNVYVRDIKQFGSGFASGDVEAHSSLSTILFRLNAGFASVIQRFTKGRCEQADYDALMHLSDASRLEAINAFEQLSKRLSQSSFALISQGKHHQKHSHKRKSKRGSSVGKLEHSRSKSAPSLLMTSSGWVRPKHGRKTSSSSKSSGSTSPKSLPPKKPVSSKPRRPLVQQPSNYPPAPVLTPQRYSNPPSNPENRKSIMSFASDSTKLGEIPEHKWARGSVPREVAFFPVNPYPEPEKQVSRFIRFFRR